MCSFLSDTFFRSFSNKYFYVEAATNDGILLPESVATLPPFSPIEGQKWFDQISSQWESQKNRFALIYFGKVQF